MKAFLLAGGRGERLQPLTLSTPKCLASINGTPLLQLWLDLCARAGITEVLVNVSHHVEQVRAFIDRRARLPRVRVSVEPRPLGSATTVAANRAFVEGEQDFWIFYADTLTDADLRPVVELHRRHDGVLTMGLFRAPDPRAAGIVQMERDGRITAFVEKPTYPFGDLANGGIYLARAALFDYLPQARTDVDFGRDVLPALAGLMYGHVIDGLLMDVGTPRSLAAAERSWAARPPGGFGR